ncbi:MAG: AMP-binding protein, partial [bacterium]|nr:AMP-binding protein [bacterium]
RSSRFMIMLAAYKALLARYTGQDDLCVGTFVAGRSRPEVEPLIGFFINTLALRTDLGGNPDFSTILARVRELTLGAFERQELPFEVLLDALEIERSLAHTPLFQVMIVMQNWPRAGVEGQDLAVSLLGTARPMANVELSLWLEDDEPLSGYLEYNATLFDRTTVERLRRHLELLLEAAVADPGTRLSALALMSGAERQQVLGEWSETPQRVCHAPTYPELFETRAERHPDKVAVIDLGSGEQVTYGRLNHRVNRLAQHLRTRGVAPEARLGVLIERSCDLLVGILGILKAGGAYVPLDPSYPRKRLEGILEDAGVALVLTHRGLEEELLPAAGPEVVD